MTHRRCQLDRPARRGFTLLEVTVAVVIMALLAAMIVPRFSGTERRQFDAVVEEVADMLIVYAQRDRLNRQPVGIFHDPDRHWLTIVLLDEPGAPGTDQYGWKVDPIVPPVKLPDMITEVYATEDYEMVDITQWPLTSRADQSRPTIQIEIATEMYSANVSLAPHAVSPQVRFSYRDQPRGSAATRDPVDLDRGGRNREEW